MAGSVTNTWILTSPWPPPFPTSYEPLMPFWNQTNTLGFVATLLVLSVLGMLLSLLMLKTSRLPGILLIAVAGLAVIASAFAMLLWAFKAVYLVPAGVVQICGGALRLSDTVRTEERE